jgi:phosphate/sulfate permease
VAAAFLAGFLAVRASYLAGLISALVAVGCLTVSVYATPGVSDAQRQSIVTQALVISPVSGAVYAAAAAWYKRFLNLSNPNRARAQQQQQRNRNSRPKSSARRR